MELHQLRYFVAVADLGSFTRAAERCLVAQPSLSQQVIKLERELGQPLFDRLGRGVRLTEAGRALYAEAAPVLASLDGLRERVTGATAPGQGAVQVGAIPTIAPYLLPPLLHRFAERFPHATVGLHENLTALTERACLEGEVDVGLVASPAGHDLLHSEPLFTEELLLALPPKHRLLEKKQVRLADLAEEAFVLLGEVHCLGEQVMTFCKQGGCRPAVRCRGSQLLTVQELVALGHGVSLLPAMACAADRGLRCEYRRMAAPRPTRTLYALWRPDRHQPPVVKAFIKELKAVRPPDPTP
jgi:LysR family hydrogen peroxide-inducible transcriptional activator